MIYTHTQNGFARHIYVVIILAVCVLLATATYLLPKGFSEDLSKIGQGSVVLVLTHDKNFMGGAEAMEMLNTVRSDYEGRVDFLAIDVNTPKGQAFTRLQGVNAEVFILFGPEGSRRDVFRAGIGENELRSVLDSVLSL